MRIILLAVNYRHEYGKIIVSARQRTPQVGTDVGYQAVSGTDCYYGYARRPYYVGSESLQWCSTSFIYGFNVAVCRQVVISGHAVRVSARRVRECRQYCRSRS